VFGGSAERTWFAETIACVCDANKARRTRECSDRGTRRLERGAMHTTGDDQRWDIDMPEDTRRHIDPAAEDDDASDRRTRVGRRVQRRSRGLISPENDDARRSADAA